MKRESKERKEKRCPNDRNEFMFSDEDARKEDKEKSNSGHPRFDCRIDEFIVSVFRPLTELIYRRIGFNDSIVITWIDIPEVSRSDAKRMIS